MDFQHQVFTKKLKFDTKKGVFQHQISCSGHRLVDAQKTARHQVCTSRAPPPPSTKTWPTVLSQPGAWQHMSTYFINPCLANCSHTAYIPTSSYIARLAHLQVLNLQRSFIALILADVSRRSLAGADGLGNPCESS